MLAKKIALGFGIAIIFPMMIHYGVSSFVPSPKWSDYQVEDYHHKYEHASEEEKAELRAKSDELNTQRELAEKTHQRVLFYVSVSLGLVALVAGAFLSLKGLGAGLMFGGIFSVFNGYANNWDVLDDRLKFVSMFLAFALLLFLAYKKIETKKEPEKSR